MDFHGVVQMKNSSMRFFLYFFFSYMNTTWFTLVDEKLKRPKRFEWEKCVHINFDVYVVVRWHFLVVIAHVLIERMSAIIMQTEKPIAMMNFHIFFFSSDLSVFFFVNLFIIFQFYHFLFILANSILITISAI